MPQAKIYGIREHLVPIRQALSDAVNESISIAFQFPAERRLQRFFPMDREDFIYPPSERTERYCEMDLGGIPITLRMCEHGEMVSYFHLYVSMKNRDNVLGELRRRGIIVTTVGPYTNFRDPEGRVIKLSEEKTIVS